ncbi:hypothetical protein KKF91_12310 [Myxococcota bacterium]|nr:hypothetical protein [Myxococcota bacterium]MBU1431315.1 hypothetical protein [Myxococcota bacterium]
MKTRLSLPLLAALTLACGPPAPPAQPWDVFHHVYLRGAPGAGRVALTFEGPSPCTERLLDALAAPGEGLEPLRATFFFSAQGLAGTPDTQRRRIFERLAEGGHELGLAAPSLPDGDAEALRGWLQEARGEVEARLRAEAPSALLMPALWRLSAPSIEALGRAGVLGQPVLLWSLSITPSTPELMTAEIARRLVDGDVLRLPGGGEGCPSVAALGGLAGHLKASGLKAVTASQLLGGRLERHAALRVLRYRGAGLSEACRVSLGWAEVGGERGPRGVRARWGIVDRTFPQAVQVLPLPIEGEAAALLSHRAALERLWASRDRWRAMPGCLRVVPEQRILSPVSQEGGAWWTVGQRVERREPRALGPPGRAVLLPTRPDLVRLEARQRLPGGVRGVVGEALERLGLEAPFLLSARLTAGVILAAPLGEATLRAADPLAEARRAIGAYVQIVEIALGEYLFLAKHTPHDAARLRRAARAGDGFLRAGPFLAFSHPGRAPHYRHLTINAAAPFDQPPELLLLRLLQSGARLKPGDLVSAAPRAVMPPEGGPDKRASTWRSALRLGLARSILKALQSPDYLRPGAVVVADGDVFLGRQRVRVAAPPGVATPSDSALPLIEQGRLNRGP